MDPNNRKDAVEICRKLQESGYQAVFCGGIVRDGLLGISPKDYDIATNATPDQVQAIFDNTIEVGKSFGVVRVVLNNSDYEVATFRSDGEYLDGRRPESVQFADMEADSNRRDFTINALYFDPISEKIFDFHNGAKDLTNKELNFVGDAGERIAEDKLRMLRFVRFSCIHDFNTSVKNQWLIRSCSSSIEEISAERIHDEMDKMLSSLRPNACMFKLMDLNLLHRIIPEFEVLPKIKWLKTIERLRLSSIRYAHFDEFLTLNWAILLLELGREVAGNALTELKFDNKTRNKILNTISNVDSYFDLKFWEQKDFCRAMLRDTFQLEKNLFEVISYDTVLFDLTHELRNKEEELRPTLPEKWFITGHDLIAANINPGISFKKILIKFQDLQLNNIFSSREHALAALSGYLAGEFCVDKHGVI